MAGRERRSCGASTATSLTRRRGRGGAVRSGVSFRHEGEPINQEVSRDRLKAVGLVVDVAGDGERAVAMACATRYFLVLMDMQMPKVNGIEATRRIRCLDGYAELPILAKTANAFDEERQACIDAGMDDHIAKPVVPAVLFETLLRWRQRPPRPGAAG